MPNLKPTEAWAALDSQGRLNSFGNGHEWQYPVFYRRNRPYGANAFMDRKNLSRVRRVYIVDAEEWERLKGANDGVA